MKIVFIILFILIIIFTTSCNKDDNPTGPDNSSYSNLISISGTISNYSLDAGKTIKLTYWGNAYSVYPDFGSGTVDANGNFNITTLNPVPDSLLEDLSGIPDSVTVSDPTVKTKGGCVLRMYTTSATIPTHTVDRGTFHSPPQAGDYYINYIYANKACSVEGTFYETNDRYIWNFQLKKGWNKMTVLLQQADPLIVKYTNAEPSGGYWFLYAM